MKGIQKAAWREGNGIRLAGQRWNLDIFLILDILRQRAGLQWMFVWVSWGLMEGCCSLECVVLVIQERARAI